MDVHGIIQGLKKRVNTSANTAVTMERSREIWKSLTNAQKQEVLALADVGQTVAHNTYKNGHLAAPIAIAMAMAAGINPAYLAGLTDKKGRFSEKNVNAFLLGLGYAITDEAPADDAGAEVIAAADAAAVVSEDTAVIECEPPLESAFEAAHEEVSALTEEELDTLLKALLIKARVSDEARKTLAEIKELLVR